MTGLSIRTYYDPSLVGTPAQANHSDNTIRINNDFLALNQAQRDFVYAHEVGHLVEGTRNELKADNYAYRHTVDNGKEAAQVAQLMADTFPQVHKESSVRLQNVITKGLYQKDTPEAHQLLNSTMQSKLLINDSSDFRFLGIGVPSAKQMEKDSYKRMYGAHWRTHWKAAKDAIKADAYNDQVNSAYEDLMKGGSATNIIVIVAVVLVLIILYLKFGRNAK